VPASIDDYYQEIGGAGRDGQPAAAGLVHDPSTIRIPRSLAARTHLGEAVLHRVVDEPAELGFLALSGSGGHRPAEPERHLPRPADLTGQLVEQDKRCRRAELLAYLGETYTPASATAAYRAPRGNNGAWARAAAHRVAHSRPDRGGGAGPAGTRSRTQRSGGPPEAPDRRAPSHADDISVGGKR
jgi:superfamily II DNA helicase RecQ